MNPLFPLDEYVPDGEPHVFGDRVYLYGSHDQEMGDRFCMRDYTVWSAPTGDLTDWKSHGVSYKKSQDKRSKGDKLVDYYAPDCVKGNDGKYYLYYVAMGPNTQNFGPMSAAVSDRPEGPFEYLGDIRYKDGTPVLKYLTNDPAVLNDNGKIWLYYGWGLGMDFRSKLLSPLYTFVESKLFHRPAAEIKATKPSIMDCAVVELEEDMLTVKGEPKAVLPSKTTAEKGSGFYLHPFYEAPSIRKFGNTYYLIYSSGANNELAYATSKCPDRDFTFRGVVISNSDLGYKGNKTPKNNAGTIHGSVEKVGDKYCVFYHRCTNNTDFSRQACAEYITMNADGSFEMAEVTTQGLEGPLKAEGSYPAAVCCQLYNPSLKPVRGNGKREKYPCVTFDGKDRLIFGAKKGTHIVFRYFSFTKPVKLSVTARGEGTLRIAGAEKKIASERWTTAEFALSFQGVKALELEITRGTLDLLELKFS